jgi:hypothetical protein
VGTFFALVIGNGYWEEPDGAGEEALLGRNFSPSSRGRQGSLGEEPSWEAEMRFRVDPWLARERREEEGRGRERVFAGMMGIGVDGSRRSCVFVCVIVVFGCS